MCNMSLGERIKQVRTEKEMTQEELGKLLNVVKSTVSQYESDKSTPDAGIISKIADIFAVSTDFLLCRTNHHSYSQTQFPHKEEDIPLTEKDLDYIEKLLKEARKRFQET